jgi:uncharacterized protein
VTGETDLVTLLREMSPELNEGEYVFCTLDVKGNPINLEPLGWFHEREGVTVILSKEQADRLNLTYSFISAWITLNIHSSLEAIGLTAAISQALTRAGISCNIVAAYYHDHLFVPVGDANHALEILQNMTHFTDEIEE